MDINKNIAIWRGNNTPPTPYHLWLKDDKLYHYDGISWKENKIDLSTMEKDGLMSKEDKKKLYNLEDKLNELNLSAYLIRGSVETLDDIPYEDLKSGDVYNILNPFYIDEKRYPEGTNVVWTGTKLDPLGGTVDFKDYSTTEEVESMISNSSNELYNRISTDLLNALDRKVDKVEGKELSTNDYTTEEKNKLQFLSNLNLFYSTSELYDLSTPSHRANIKKIRINLSVMGISLINSVSIMVADDNAYDGLIHLNIYDTNSLLTVVSKNVVNLSNNLGKYVTWYFTPFKLTENINYEFFADNEQLMRIHLSGNKNEGVVCIDQYSYTRENFTPALGINIEPIVIDEIYSKVENILEEVLNNKTDILNNKTDILNNKTDILNNKTDILNNRSEIDAIGSKVINFLYDVDEVRLNLSTTNAELDKTKQELSELQTKIQDARAIAEEGLDKADSALSQIAGETKERAAQDRALAEAASNERAARTSADANLQAQITETKENTALYLNQLNEKVDANTTSISKINAELGNVKEVQTGHNNSIAQLNTTIEEHAERIAQLESGTPGGGVDSPDIAQINATLDEIKAEQTEQNSTLADHEERLVYTERDLVKVREKYDGIISELVKSIGHTQKAFVVETNDSEGYIMVDNVKKIIPANSIKAFRFNNTFGSSGNNKGIKSFRFLVTNTSEMKSMAQMFHGCSSLTSLDVTNFDTSAVTNMGYMFWGCSSLTSLDLTNFDTSAVTSIGSMFPYCSSLISLDLTNFDTSAATYMGYMFIGCSSLTTLDLSSFDTSAVTDMGSMFDLCSSLNSLLLGPNFFKTSAVTDIDFSSCDKWTNETVVASLVTNSYDRATAGLNTLTLKLHKNTKEALTDEQKATITSKGYTIA